MKKLCKRFYNNPIFIIGHGRSGTTIIQRALMEHPEIIGTNFESPMVSRFAFLKGLFSYQDEAKNEFYNISTQFSNKYFDQILTKLIFESVFGENYAFRRLFWELRKQKIKYFKIKHWVAKIFPDFDIYNSLNRLYPKSKYIYIVRNGIDVINSGQKKEWFKDKSFEELCLSWTHHHNLYKFMIEEAKKPKTRVFFVKYEDFKADSDTVLKNIFLFLNLPSSEKSLTFVKQNVIGSMDKANFKADNAIEQIKNRNNPYNNWDANKKEIFTKICQNSMIDLNYNIPF